MDRRRLLLAAPALLLPALLPGQRAAAQFEPHAWLFGGWSGGLLPVNPSQSQDGCLGRPSVIFTRDIVLRASLTDPGFRQRLVETVRATPDGAEIRFIPIPRPQGALALPGLGADFGFGCVSPDLLSIRRLGPNEIIFPGCIDFPSPLVRCDGR